VRHGGDRQSAPVWTSPDGIALRIRLTPRSARDDLGGTVETPDGPAVQARVRAPPADNAANTALLMLVAGALSVPKSSVELITGHKSRLKTLTVAGNRDALLARLRDIAAGP
jgi:uncharacterized protein YggU (UPF0235/DUF167 family)